MNTPNPTLYNCRPGDLEPDWSRFYWFRIAACREHEGNTLSYVEDHEADFWTVYGVDLDGHAEAITDCTTQGFAAEVANLFFLKWYHDANLSKQEASQ